MESGKLTKKALAHLNDSGEKRGPSSVISALSMLSIRNKNESPEEKKKRKKQLKEYRKVIVKFNRYFVIHNVKKLN